MSVPIAVCGSVLTTDGVRHAHAVIVAGDRIVEICPVAELSSGLMRREFAGATIIPGLIDTHVHSDDWQAPLFLAHGVTSVRDTGCALEEILDRRPVAMGHHGQRIALLDDVLGHAVAHQADAD